MQPPNQHGAVPDIGCGNDLPAQPFLDDPDDLDRLRPVGFEERAPVGVLLGLDHLGELVGFFFELLLAAVPRVPLGLLLAGSGSADRAGAPPEVDALVVWVRQGIG